jgi:hypothetical protein
MAEENKISHQETPEFVFTEQKTIKEGGKKIIVPSILVKKDEVEQMKTRTEAILNGASLQQTPSPPTKEREAVNEERPPPPPPPTPKPEVKPTSSAESKVAEIAPTPSSKAAFKVTVEQKLVLPILDTSPSIYLIDAGRSIDIEYKAAPLN